LMSNNEEVVSRHPLHRCQQVPFSPSWQRRSWIQQPRRTLLGWT